jgi:hypothetical protein
MGTYEKCNRDVNIYLLLLLSSQENALTGALLLLPCLAAGYTKEAPAAGTCVVGPSRWRETR